MKLLKMRFISGLLAVAVLAVPMRAAAHVTVAPSEVLVSSRQTFAVSVPNERDVPVVGVRLVVPEGLTSVRAHAKPGWTIQVATTGEGEDVNTSEIIWSSAGSDVPVSMKDEFLFGARLPADAGELQWKAYETYADGTVVAWEQEPGSQRPASVTRVLAELPAETAVEAARSEAADADKSADMALYVALAALALGVVSLVVSLTSRRSA